MSAPVDIKRPVRAGASLKGWAIAITVTATFALLAASAVDLSALSGNLAGIALVDWATVMALSVVMGILRAIRVRIAFPLAPAAPLMRASFIHGAANAALPARLGELALPLLLKRNCSIDLARGAGVLLLLRALDLLTLVGLGGLLAGALNIFEAPQFVTVLITLAGAACLAAAAFAPVLLHRLPATGSRTVIARILDGARAYSGGRLVAAFGLTILIWGVLSAAAFLSARAVGLDAQTGPSALAAIAGSLAFASPVNGAANFGPFEAAFAGVLTLSGAPAGLALAAALHLHLSALGSAGLTGLLALGATPHQHTGAWERTI